MEPSRMQPTLRSMSHKVKGGLPVFLRGSPGSSYVFLLEKTNRWAFDVGEVSLVTLPIFTILIITNY